MISPTPGRVVWFNPGTNYPHIHQGDQSQPLAATIAYVHNERMVNLSVTDQNGVQHAVCSVHLVQEGDECAPSSYAEWMPYQIGQAKKDPHQVETKVYADGTAATGTAPLPDESPAQ